MNFDQNENQLLELFEDGKSRSVTNKLKLMDQANRRKKEN